MTNSMRKSGIDIIGDVPWGTHICQFYHTKEDLMDTLVPYFKKGLENDEFCLWVTSQPLEIEDAIEALRRVVPDLDIFIEKGQIEFISYSDWFLKEGLFDPELVLSRWVEKLNYASYNGYEGLRLSGNTSWLRKEDRESFIKYKEESDKVIGNCRMINLCTYSIDKHKVVEIVHLSLNHQLILFKNGEKLELIESSKRKIDQETAIKATKDWEHTFDAVPDLISIIDDNYKLVRVNKAMAAKMGMTPDECIGLTCYRIVHGTKKPPTFCPHRQLLKSGLEHTAEVCEDSLGGYFIVSVSPVHDSKGVLTGSIHVARDINERRQMEETLRESEEKYRNLIETANEGILVIDAGHRITYVNEKMADMLGYIREEIFGKSVRDFTDDEGKTVFEENMVQRRQGINGVHEFRFITESGLPLWTQVNSKSLFDKNGKFSGSISMLTDITKRKEAETKLKETHDNLENLVEERTAELEKAFHSYIESKKGLDEAQKMAHIGNWEWEISTDKAFWSDEMFCIFGLNPKDPVPNLEEFYNYIHPEDRDYVRNESKRDKRSKPLSIDFRIIRDDGEERSVIMQSELVIDEKNMPVRMKGTVQDITERKMSEERIRNLADLVESSSDAIGTISLESITTSWNKGAEQVYGYSQEEMLGKSISIVAPSHLSEETKKLSKRIKQGESIKNYETVRLRKDGKLIDVSITFSPVYDLHGRMTAISFISRDITKRIETEKALAEAEIARKKEIHHRIKNNLQVISSLLDLQAEKFKNREYLQCSEVLEAFKESQERVISMALIHEELYKGGGFEELNFSKYIEQLAANLSHTYRLGNTNICLKLNLEENIFFDMDVAVPLGIIINELVSNSFKHAFKNRNDGEIQIKLHREENREYPESKNEDTKITCFILSISDNGVGIPENLDVEELESLGLQLVTSLVDQLDGQLEIKRCNGTEFTFKFKVIEKNIRF